MKKTLYFIPALLWMGFIFLMSAAPGEVSGEQSGFVVRLLLGILRALFGAAEVSAHALWLIETLLRKAAHMGEYAVLAILYAFALRGSGAKRPALTALVLSVLYAATDELHQAFVPGRGPSPVDVAIDTLGAFLGLICHQALLRLSRKTSNSIIS